MTIETVELHDMTMWAITCDTPDCGAEITSLTDAEDAHALAQHHGWRVDLSGRGMCREHGAYRDDQIAAAAQLAAAAYALRMTTIDRPLPLDVDTIPILRHLRDAITDTYAALGSLGYRADWVTRVPLRTVPTEIQGLITDLTPATDDGDHDDH